MSETNTAKQIKICAFCGILASVILAAGLVDLGPLLFIWILLVSVKGLRAAKHIADR
jgi:hypothetical protein